MKFLPTKQYCIVPGCGLVYCDHENVSTNYSLLTKFTPRKIPAIQYIARTPVVQYSPSIGSGTGITLFTVMYNCLPLYTYSPGNSK